jgi:hypothetical protein
VFFDKALDAIVPGLQGHSWVRANEHRLYIAHSVNLAKILEKSLDRQVVVGDMPEQNPAGQIQADIPH